MKKEDLKKAVSRFEKSINSIENSRLLIDHSADKALEKCVTEVPVCGDHELWNNKG